MPPRPNNPTAPKPRPNKPRPGAKALQSAPKRRGRPPRQQATPLAATPDLLASGAPHEAVGARGAQEPRGAPDPTDLSAPDDYVNCHNIASHAMHSRPVGQPADIAQLSDEQLTIHALRAVLTDPAAPAAAKAQAARTLAEIRGLLGRHAEPPQAPAKPLGAMTRAEIEAELTAGAAQRST